MSKAGPENKTFCILPWVHMHIWPNGVTYPCCLATNDYVLGNTNEKSFQELWNSDRMRTLRKNIVDGKPTGGCSRCYEHEANGSVSMRQNMNSDFKEHLDRVELTNDDGSVDDVFMAYMDIRFSNICNMKCRTCGPELSSSWVDDAVKMNRYGEDQPKVLKIKRNLSEFWDDVEPWIDSVERIYFAGGEPLIMDEHYKILEHLIEIGKTDIVIAYNTNFSKLTYKRKDVIELWKHFPNLNIGASLDAMGDRAELMRSGTIWKDIEANRQRVLEEAPHAKFQISSTISAYNAWHCVDFFDDWLERGWVKPDQIDINILLFPDYQRLQILPLDIKQDAINKIEKFLIKWDLEKVDVNGRAIAGFRALIKALSDEAPNLIPEFMTQNKLMDDLRSEEFTQTFPELETLKI